MASASFDTQAAVTVLRDSGIDEAPAIAIVNTVRDAQSASLAEVATKVDLEASVAVVRADLEATVAGLKADFYRALWIQGAGLVVIQIAIAGFIITAVQSL